MLPGRGRRPEPIDLKVPEDMSRAVAARLEQQNLRNFAIINPGGGWPTKRWCPARYGELAERMASQLGMQVVVTTGPGEESLYRGLVGCLPRRAPSFPGPFSGARSAHEACTPVHLRGHGAVPSCVCPWGAGRGHFRSHFPVEKRALVGPGRGGSAPAAVQLLPRQVLPHAK